MLVITQALLTTQPFTEVLGLGTLAKSILLIVAVAVLISLLILGASYVGVWLDDREARR